MSLRDVMQFLDEYETCVLATVSVDGKPQSATVGFSCSKDPNYKEFPLLKNIIKGIAK